MSDVKVERKATMSRQDAARWIADLADALAGDGRATVEFGGSTVELDVPDRIACEAELEVDGDEVELEFELTWTTARPEAVVPAPAEPAETEEPVARV